MAADAPIDRDRLVAAMSDYFGPGSPHIEHTLTVLGFAEEMLAQEPGDAAVVVAAAVLHDVGIPPARARYGSAAGHYQEIEGPPVAREILERLGHDPQRIEHVCRIVANHHSARDIDTPEFRIVWDADWLVNLPRMMPDADPNHLRQTIDRTFKTPTGRRLARQLFLPRP